MGGCGGGSSTSGSAAATATPAIWGSCPTPSFSFAPAGTVGATVDYVAQIQMKSQYLPGMTIALAKQGNIIYAQGYGYADLGDCQPMQSDDASQIASITKTFTATAILQLQSTGAIDIDKPVVTYLPDYSFDPRITVRMLLNHVSGLADIVTFPDFSTWTIQGVPEQAALTAIAQAPLQFTPGSEFMYSNSNYFVLGSLIFIRGRLAVV
jgi:D-alanyl-D-alanine carboxypeptidase